jgi:hypothetical protein
MEITSAGDGLLAENFDMCFLLSQLAARRQPNRVSYPTLMAQSAFLARLGAI